MESIRFDARDRSILLICAVIFIASLAIGLTWFDDVMPEASIEFTVDRAESGQIAQEYLAGLDAAPPDSFRHAAIFSWDNQAKTYLEKELGLEQAQQVFGDPVRLWSWRHRWFSPGNKEEFQVYVSPEGDVISMSHLEEEEAEGAALDRAEAFTIAETFLSQSLGIDTASVSLNEGSQQNRPNRRDWTFVWKVKGFEPLPGSEYRHEVVIHGDRIAGHREYLHVPETWSSDYRKLRSYNNLAGSVASFLMFVTFAAMVVIFIQKLRARQIQWKTALLYGSIAAILLYANNLNSLPNALYGYDTTTSWSGFLIQNLFVYLLAALALGIFIALMTASGEAVYRERHPDMPSLPRLLTVRGLRTKRAFLNIVVGITMTAFFFAYQTLFYMASEALGGWSPADVPYDNLLNTSMPWLAVLMIGFLPAVSEEFTSRLFSIPLLEKLFKGKYLWLAVIIPAFIWGFGHASYPNQPFWIRGVEVGIAGVIIGTLFLRFGILAPLLWHYTVDAFYTGLILFGSDNIYFIVTAYVGAGLVIVPLIAALIAYLRTGTFLPETGMLNADIVSESLPLAVEEEDIEEAEPTTIEATNNSTDGPAPLPPLVRIAALVILAAALLVVPSSEIGDFIQFNTTRSEAIESFSDTLAALGWADTDTLEVAATLGGGVGTRSGAETYTLKHVGSIEEFNARFDTLHGVGRWTVMAWQPLNRLRFWGLVDGATGDVVRLNAMLPEEMPGDSLSEEEALALAKNALRGGGVEVDSLNVAENSSSERPARLDHTIVFETHEGDPRNLGDAKLRWTVSVDGDFISADIYPRLKVPESWQRERRASTGMRTTRTVIIVLIRALAFGYFFMVLLSRSRAGLVKWKRSLIWALLPLAFYLLALPGELESFGPAYFWSTDIPWSVFLGTGAITTLVVYSAAYLVFMIVFAGGSALWDDEVVKLKRPTEYQAPLDTLFAAVGGFALYALGSGLTGLLNVAFPQSMSFHGWGIPGDIAVNLPMLSMLSSTMIGTATTAASLMVFAMLWEHLFATTPLRIVFALLALVAGQAIGAIGGAEMLHSLADTVINLAVVAAVLLLFVRGSGVRLVAISWLSSLIPQLVQTWSIMPSLRLQVIVTGVIGLALLGLWLTWGGRRVPALEAAQSD